MDTRLSTYGRCIQGAVSAQCLEMGVGAHVCGGGIRVSCGRGPATTATLAATHLLLHLRAVLELQAVLRLRADRESWLHVREG